MSTVVPPEPAGGGSRVPVRWLLVFGLVAFVALAVARTYFGPPSGEHPAVGGSLRVSGLVPLAGDVRPVTPDALRGKVVVVNFWATWCAPCRMELPQIARLHRELAGRNDCVLLAVAVDEGPLEAVRAEAEGLLARLRVDLPTYADPTGATLRSFLEAGGDGSVPTTLLLDRQGAIRAVWVGYNPDLEEEVITAIEQLQSSTASPGPAGQRPTES